MTSVTDILLATTVHDFFSYDRMYRAQPEARRSRANRAAAAANALFRDPVLEKLPLGKLLVLYPTPRELLKLRFVDRRIRNVLVETILAAGIEYP